MPFTTRPLPRVPAAADRTRKVRAWLVYLAILAFLALCVFWLRGILLPFIIALLVAYIFEPAVTRMHGVGLPRWIGVLVVYAALIGAIVLFLNYLVPIIEVESKKFGEKFGTVIQRAPSLYERLEGGVGEFFNSLGAKPEEAAPAPSSPVASEDRWGFGPPVEKIPTLPPPSLPVLPEIAFDSSEKELADAGIPAIPKATAVRLEGGTATLEQPQQPRSNLTIEQVKPGVWGVSLQNSTIEIRKTGDSTFTIAAHEEGYEPRWGGDMKAQVVESMRRGLRQFSSSLLSAFFTFFQGLVQGLINALVGIIVVFLVGAFAMIDAPRLLNLARNNVPRRYRDLFEDLLHRLDAGLAGVVRGQLLICLVNGVLSTIGFFIFIPEYAVVLGIFAGILSLIPIFGTIISSIPAILVALSIGWGPALGVLAWILGIHCVEAYILNPSIIGHQARIHPIVVVFVLIAGEFMFGIKGVLLAVPITSVLQSTIQCVYARIKGQVI